MGYSQSGRDTSIVLKSSRRTKFETVEVCRLNSNNSVDISRYADVLDPDEQKAFGPHRSGYRILLPGFQADQNVVIVKTSHGLCWNCSMCFPTQNLSNDATHWHFLELVYLQVIQLQNLSSF